MPPDRVSCAVSSPALTNSSPTSLACDAVREAAFPELSAGTENLPLCSIPLRMCGPGCLCVAAEPARCTHPAQLSLESLLPVPLQRDPCDTESGGVEDVTVPLSFRVYECNKRCKCNINMCTNRLVQHGLQVRLQLFKTQNKGWGIRCLDDIAKGSFVCIYAGRISPC